MPLRPGDVVSVTYQPPPIELVRYAPLKIHVTITRTVGDNPAADVADALKEAERLGGRVGTLQLTAWSEIMEKVSSASTQEEQVSALLKCCKDLSQGLGPAGRVVVKSPIKE